MCPICGWPVGDLAGHVPLAHPGWTYVEPSYAQANAVFEAAREMVAEGCCPVWTAEDDRASPFPSFGTIDGRPAMRWPDGRIETEPDREV